MTNTKIIDLDELCNFYVHDFFGQNCLMFEHVVQSFHFLYSKFEMYTRKYDKKNIGKNTIY